MKLKKYMGCILYWDKTWNTKCACILASFIFLIMPNGSKADMYMKIECSVLNFDGAIAAKYPHLQSSIILNDSII